MKSLLTVATMLACASAHSLDLKGVELGKAATEAQLHDAFGITFQKYECDMVPIKPCGGGTRIEGCRDPVRHLSVQYPEAR
jgi:hypothetical protein